MISKKRIAFHTLGCKLNFSESSTLGRQFDPEQFELVDFEETADVYVIHTCSVTAVAEKKCRTVIKQAHHRNPDAEVAVIGCAVQANAEVFEKMEGVSIVLGNNDKFRLPEIIKEKHEQTTLNSDINKSKTFVPSYSLNDRTRSFFKIQDGCDYFCTFCSIPYLRGRSRSDTIENTIAKAKEIAATQAREIILTGVNIGDFGRHHNEDLYGLLQQLVEVEGIERIRISSIEPELLNDNIINLVYKSNKLMPHFHIPLQAGNNEILSVMKRKYEREVFADRVMKIKRLMPDACIAADIIVGFPGESEEHFNDAFQFIESLPVTYLHVFSYSERPGTKAINMEEKVKESDKKIRSKKLHELSARKKLEFYRSQTGKTSDILWESDESNGYMMGWTENYIQARTPFNTLLINTIANCRLIQLNTSEEPVFDVEIL